MIRERPGEIIHVIARAKPVAISCRNVRIGTPYQEIATSGCALLAMTEMTFG